MQLELLDAAPSPANGLCFCTGCYGVRADNDFPGMVKRFGDHIHFLHLRSTKRDSEGNFFEADHLDGDIDMYEVIKEVLLMKNEEIFLFPCDPIMDTRCWMILKRKPIPVILLLGD